jgi:hypothetical protein
MKIFKKPIIAMLVSAAIMYIPAAVHAEVLTFSYGSTRGSNNSTFTGTSTPIFKVGEGYTGKIDATVSSSYTKDGNTTTGFDITSFELYKVGTTAAIGSILPVETLVSSNKSVKKYNESVNFSFSNAAAGDYFFKIVGTGTRSAANASPNFLGAPQGTYSNVTTLIPVVTSPVPEPETYAMLLAGLGVIGFFCRRKAIGSSVQNEGLLSSGSLAGAVA